MTCYYPKPAWVDPVPNKNGNRQLRFQRRGSNLNEDFMIPCGKCIGCRADKRQEWAIRMYHEKQFHRDSCFITLTYADDNQTQLDKRHVQNFIKTFRKYVSPVRYFACGEYGEKTRRPHYHAILFGTDLLGGAYTISDKLWGNARLDKAWGHGFASVGSTEYGAMCYVAGYATKKLRDPDTFTLMSRRPPIGYQWAEQYQRQLRNLEHVVIEGKKLPVPKAYLNWYEANQSRPDQVDLDSVKANRGGQVKHLTMDELVHKERNHKAREREKKETI